MLRELFSNKHVQELIIYGGGYGLFPRCICYIFCSFRSGMWVFLPLAHTSFNQGTVSGCNGLIPMMYIDEGPFLIN